MDLRAKTKAYEETISSLGGLKKQISEISINNKEIDVKLANIIESLKSIYRSEALELGSEDTDIIKVSSFSDALNSTIYAQQRILKKILRIESFLKETIQ